MALDKITLDKKKIAIGLGKACLNAMQGKWWEAAARVLDAAGLVGLKDAPPPDAEQGLALLLQAGMINAAGTVFQRRRHLSLDAGSVDEAAVEAALDGVALTPPTMTRAAFTAVEGWAAVAEMRGAFASWLKAARIPDEHHDRLIRDFVEEIPISLALTIRARPKDFAALEKELDRATPLDEAARRAANWRRYRLKLIEDTRRPMRRIDKDIVPPFSLHDLYIPLFASWTEWTTWHHTTKEHLIGLHGALHDWAQRADAEDPVRLVAGGPGSGKSSACKMFAAELATANHRVLLVPLGRLDYHAGDAWREISQYVESNDQLGHDGLNAELADDGEPILLILDGLDELAKAGRLGEVTVRDFVDKIGLAIQARNRDRSAARILLLLAGRPGAAPETRGVVQTDHARLYVEGFKTIDGTDQRNTWWHRFGFPTGLPEQVRDKGPQLDDVTAQPLLNWLLGQVFLVRRIEHVGIKTDLRDIYSLYAELLDHVLRRTHRERTGEPIDRIIEKDIDPLAEMLEEVSVAAWHEGDRTVPMDTVRRRLSDHHGEILKQISDRDELAIRAVLNSFFCVADDGGRHETVEFTHKSFREFLTARRLLRLIDDTVYKLSAPDPSSARTLLGDWLALCGINAIDHDLLNTLRAGIATKPRDTLAIWRSRLCSLLQITIDDGMPPSAENLWSKEADRRARNAEEALLACLNATTLAIEAPIYRHPLKWGNDPAARARWLNRLMGPTTDRPSSHIAPLCISNIDIGDSFLQHLNLKGATIAAAQIIGANLQSANLESSNLEDASIIDTNLNKANLCRALLNRITVINSKLDSADLSDAHLEEARIENANLDKSRLKNAILKRANITNSQFNYVDFTGANLIQAYMNGISLKNSHMENSNLFGASLKSTNFERANLRGAILEGANLEDSMLLNANLNSANLKGACLENANLGNADLESANLEGADLKGANLKGANLKSIHVQSARFILADLEKLNLKEANLVGANFFSANLKGANMQKSNLKGVNFENANLSYAKLEDANLENANLRGANLKSIRLKNANLNHADVRGANFQSANLEGASFIGANLKGAKFDSALGLSEKQLADLRRRAQVNPIHPTG